MVKVFCRPTRGRRLFPWRRALMVCVAGLAVVLVWCPQRVRARPALTNSKICNLAAHKAALETGIPEAVLLAISLTETGRRRGKLLTAWPWTVNMEGKGYWFDTRAEALSFAQEHLKSGARSFDVGCFQINYKWHGHAFASISAMFDPNSNAVYAAKYLLDLYHEKGNWPDAVGAYHSRTPKYAKKYTARFVRIYTNLAGGGVNSKPVRTASVPLTGDKAVNPSPLLQSRSRVRASSG